MSESVHCCFDEGFMEQDCKSQVSVRVRFLPALWGMYVASGNLLAPLRNVFAPSRPLSIPALHSDVPMCGESNFPGSARALPDADCG
jgi:hypothetical protein